MILLFAVTITAQEQYDASGKEKINYRRTDNSQPPTTYTQQPKEQVFPLGWNTRTLGKVATGTGVWTELNPKVPRVDYVGIDFINADTGWACGGSGAIIKTTNGGDDWTISETPITNLLLKIHSYNGQVVIATGFDGIILRSEDGGENFVEVPSGVGSGTDLWGVQMLNDTLGWVCGMNQTLLKTIDAGETWQQVFPGLNEHYWSLDFLSEQYGMIACGGGKVLKTTDGGNNWTEIQAGDTRPLYTIDIIDSLHIAAAGEFGNEFQYEGGKNLYSSDGGETWTVNPDVPTGNDANWIEFVDVDTGYTINFNNGLWKTTNRGESWLDPDVSNYNGDWQIELLEDGTGYYGGEELNIYKRTNGLDNWSKIFLNYDWSDVFFINDLKGFFVSGDLGGKLHITNDGGLSFQKVENSPRGNCITFTNDQMGYVGHRSRTRIYKTMDGGSTWNLVNITGLTDTIASVNRIFFINESTGWAVASGILKTTDQGSNWITQLNEPFSGITSIHFVDSLYGWASIVGSRPYKTTDGGQTWIEQTNLNIWDTRDVFFIDHQNGFLLGFNELYKTTDGGINWVLNPSLTGFNIAELSTYENSTLFIIGDKTYRSIDGGENWYEFTELDGIRVTGLSLLNSGFGFAVGELGLIMQYVDSTYIPVELISFQGESIKNKVILSWQTATEINNQGFEIERTDSKYQIWKNIGYVQGNGTTTEEHRYSFAEIIDKPANYYYRLKQVDYNGTFEYSNIIEVIVNSPLKYILAQNFPNPFNSSTIITYQIPKDEFVTLKVYDILGNEVTTLIEEHKKAGYYKMTFSVNDLSTGIYFYRLRAGKFNSIKKLILLK